MWKMQRVLPLAAAVLLAAGAPASAQTPPSGFQVGGQLSTLRLSDFDATNAGFGGRGSFDLTRFVTLEGEINFFANDEFEVSSPGLERNLSVEYKRRRLEGFFGPKVGVRYERFGIFAKARPGFSRLTHRGIGCVGPDCALAQMLLAIPEYKTEFAVDLGGVFEFYPTDRTVARVDLGTTVIRHRSTAPPCNDCNSQNFSSRFGFGFRF
jgi:hypothetical protein